MATRRKKVSGSARATINHDEIRNWVEEHGGHPAIVKRTRGARGEQSGILRIDFPGFSGEDSLEPIEWEDFFERFEQANLAFLYQAASGRGRASRFNKLVQRDSVQVDAAESEGASGSGRTAKKRTAKRTTKKGTAKKGTAKKSATSRAGRGARVSISIARERGGSTRLAARSASKKKTRKAPVSGTRKKKSRKATVSGARKTGRSRGRS